MEGVEGGLFLSPLGYRKCGEKVSWKFPPSNLAGGESPKGGGTFNRLLGTLDHFFPLAHPCSPCATLFPQEAELG